MTWIPDRHYLQIQVTRAGGPAWQPWQWRCTSTQCGNASGTADTQPDALTAGLDHLAGLVDRHHAMEETYPHWNGQRATATCTCGYEIEEKSESGAEGTFDLHHGDMLKQAAARRSAPRPATT
ncbi:hypothetical protein ABTX82_01630 [Streptomyces lavendulae]|uniref:hypothetical protein n=1 Tax=Streptomyces lavendulae TaxID=1914 RepID=UPI0033291B35